MVAAAALIGGEWGVALAGEAAKLLEGVGGGRRVVVVGEKQRAACIFQIGGARDF